MQTLECQEDYQSALDRISLLMDSDPDPDSAEGSELCELSDCVSEYEDKLYTEKEYQYAEYCDKLYVFAVGSLIQEHTDDYGINLSDAINQMWFVFYIDDVRIEEIILSITGCLDADIGEY